MNNSDLMYLSKILTSKYNRYDYLTGKNKRDLQEALSMDNNQFKPYFLKLQKQFNDSFLWAVSLVMKQLKRSYKKKIINISSVYNQIEFTELASQLKNECEQYYLDWVQQNQQMNQYHALGIIYTAYNGMLIDSETMKQAFLLISLKYERYSDYYRYYVCLKIQGIPVIIETIQYIIRHSPRQFDLNHKQIIAIINSQDQEREYISKLYQTFVDMLDKTNLKYTQEEYKQLLDIGVIQQKTFNYICNYIDPVQQYIEFVGNDQCVICFNNSEIYKYKQCKHTACKECITNWFRQNNNCHMCRQQITYITNFNINSQSDDDQWN